MLQLRKSNERGHANHGWLDSYHTFSFADYYDPEHMGFSVLRVINEDRIDGGQGFPTHPHRDMEIITYVIDGALQHKDSMGNSTVIKPGEVQTMSAGTGVRHSEFNPLPNTTTHLLQIWIESDQEGHTPGYGQKSFTPLLLKNSFVLVASGDGREDSIKINQDANMYVGKAATSGEKTLSLASGRNVWIQVIQGEVKVGDLNLTNGDGASGTHLSELQLRWSANSEFIVFDLP
jgi:quercetin 2,3-dioxygenase